MQYKQEIMYTEGNPRLHNFLFVLHSSIYKQQLYNKSFRPLQYTALSASGRYRRNHINNCQTVS